MPCISSTGKPTSLALLILRTLAQGALRPEDVSDRTGLPLPRVRSGMRELRDAGFATESEGAYALSAAGAKLIA